MNRIEVCARGRVLLLATALIRHIEAKGNKACFHTFDFSIDSTATLKHYHNLLHGNGFYRIHDKLIVNTQHVKEFGKGKNNSVWLSCGTHLMGSERKMPGFRRHLRKNYFLHYD